MALWKLTKITSHIALRSLHAALIGLQRFPTSWQLRQRRSHVITEFSKLALKDFNIQLNVVGTVPNDQNYLIVSNHLSYVDIMLLSSQFSASYVTSQEIREMPVLGTVCDLGGCLYVERRSRTNLQNEVKDLTEALQNNLSIIIFPEATSTNGESVLRFRRPLFQAAIDSGTSVLPVCLNYLAIDGVPINSDNRDSVFWYADMQFPGHFKNIMKLRSIEVELIVLPPISVTGNEPTQLAEESHTAVVGVFKPVLSAPRGDS